MSTSLGAIDYFKNNIPFSLEVELLTHGCLFIYFSKSNTVLEIPHQFAFPLTVLQGSLFSTSSQHLFLVFFFYESFPNWCEVTTFCGFDLYFLNDSVMLSTF